MFEGTRLSYIVPGYTGHIPKNVQEPSGPYVEPKPTNHIPKYQGYIKSMQAENIFGKTYGKITYDIQHNNFHQGQDLPPEIRYKSHLQDTFQNQKNVQLRTAAEIVGVPTKNYVYEIVKKKNNLQLTYQFKPESNTAKTFFQTDANGQNNLINSIQSQNTGVNDDVDRTLQKFYGDEGPKEPLRLGTPLPGYTGTQKRVVAANIFGQTFANSRKSAILDEEKIQNERRQNFITQATKIPPLKR